MDIRDAARIALAHWDGKPPKKGPRSIGEAMEHLRKALAHTQALTDAEIEQAWEEISVKLAKRHTTSLDWVQAGIQYAEKVQGLRK